ncbi:MAG: helix-turn-helix transcriptional regulator [Ruminococcaceae bacterium]|nr:helix-turn-helix transcriptional regulator [Oscillospiraceae bacterium]
MNCINRQIKNLRKSKDITQEQLAEIVGVSPQAVSRWECGTTYPDILLLPRLAEVFNTTVDELLGVNEKQKAEEITNIINEAEKLINKNITVEPIKNLRKALEKYPKNDRLLCTLLYALYVASEDEALCCEYDEEIISIAEWIEKYSVDNYCRNEANRVLFRHYCDTDRKKEALYIATKMADIETCIQRNKYWSLEGKERVEFLKERISDDLRQLLWDIWAFSEHSYLDEIEKSELDKLRENIDNSVNLRFDL